MLQRGGSGGGKGLPAPSAPPPPDAYEPPNPLSIPLLPPSRVGTGYPPKAVGSTVRGTPTYLLGIRTLGVGGLSEGGEWEDPQPAPAPQICLGRAGSPGLLRMCQPGSAGRSQGWAVGNGYGQRDLPASVSPPDRGHGAVRGASLGGFGHRGVIQTHQDRDEVPSAAPSPLPKPSLGLRRGSGSPAPVRALEGEGSCQPHSALQRFARLSLPDLPGRGLCSAGRHRDTPGD